MMATDSLFGVIQHYQRSIERCQDDEGRLLHCINKLYTLPVKLKHLQETGVGKTVNSLRKFNGEIGVAAKTLVTKWKEQVTAEEELEKNCRAAEETQNHVKDRRSSSSDEDMVPMQEENTANHNSNGREQHKTPNADKKENSNSHNSVSKQEQKANDNKTHRHHHHKERERTEHKQEQHTKHHREKDRKHHSERDKHRKSDEAAKSDKRPKDEEKTAHKSSSSSSGGGGASASSSKREKTDEERQQQKLKEKSQHKEKRDKDHQRHEKSKHEKHESNRKEREKEKEKEKEKRDNDKEKPTTSTAAANAFDAELKRRSNAGSLAHAPHAKKLKIEKAVSDDDNADVDSNDGCFDSSMGANFEDVLGALNVPKKKVKKSLNNFKIPAASGNAKEKTTNASKIYSNAASTSAAAAATTSKHSFELRPALLSSHARLEPLDPSIALELPSISANYRPMPLNQTVMDCVFKTTNSSASRNQARQLTAAETLAHSISSKNQRTKIYSGVRTGQILQVPSLFDLCIRVLQKNIDALEYTGGVPFEVLRPVLERATPQQLFNFEEYNPYIMEDTDPLWLVHVQRNYRLQKREENESWREMYMRCQDDEDRKLAKLAQNIKQSQKEIAAPVRKTQLAFVDSFVKPPRGVLRKQEQYGTKAKLIATPAARVASLSSVTPNAAKTGDARLRIAPSVRDHAQVSSSVARPKKAPLMVKTLQFMRGRLKR